MTLLEPATPPAASAAPADAAATPLRLHMPVDVRSAALAVLALIATLYALRWAAAVFIPLLLGLMLSYALGPAVDWLQRQRLPRPAGVALMMAALLGALGGTAYSMADDATALVESLPDAAQKLRTTLRQARAKPGAIDKVQQAAARLEQAAEESAGTPPPVTQAGKGVTRVQIERPHFNIKDHLWSGTLGLVGLAGQATMVVFITWFMLLAGDTFRRKLVKIAGPGFAEKRITIQVLDDITQQIQRYLLVQVGLSVAVGIATWAVCLVLGLERAAVWGVFAGVLNLVPYIGSLVTAAGLMLVGLTQFGTPGIAVMLGLASLAIHMLTGQLLGPWITGRASRMNALVIFVGVLAFGWLWGIAGLLLGAPVLMVVKAVCDRVDSFKPVGELMSA